MAKIQVEQAQAEDFPNLALDQGKPDFPNLALDQGKPQCITPNS
jgi:hypothetical protein